MNYYLSYWIIHILLCGDGKNLSQALLQLARKETHGKKSVVTAADEFLNSLCEEEILHRNIFHISILESTSRIKLFQVCILSASRALSSYLEHTSDVSESAPTTTPFMSVKGNLCNSTVFHTCMTLLPYISENPQFLPERGFLGPSQLAASRLLLCRYLCNEVLALNSEQLDSAQLSKESALKLLQLVWKSCRPFEIRCSVQLIEVMRIYLKICFSFWCLCR